MAKKLVGKSGGGTRQMVEKVLASQLRKNDLVICKPGDVIPGDGKVVAGMRQRG